MFFGYFDPTNITFDYKVSIFSGDLSDVSAIKATLVIAYHCHCPCHIRCQTGRSDRRAGSPIRV